MKREIGDERLRMKRRERKREEGRVIERGRACEKTLTVLYIYIYF